MDFQFQLIVWLVVLVVGGPVLVILGMFVALLLPWVILAGLVILALAVIGRSLDKHGPPVRYDRGPVIVRILRTLELPGWQLTLENANYRPERRYVQVARTEDRVAWCVWLLR